MNADLIIIGDQSGWSCFRAAPRPATCGLDIDVPLMMSNSRPWLPGGATAASTSTPGALTSGFRMSPPPAVSGPSDEKSAIRGAGLPYEIAAAEKLAVAVAGAASRYALIASPAVAATCTVGTMCRIASVVVALAGTLVLARIIPAAPAACAAAALSTRTLPPRSQMMILPVTFAGSSTSSLKQRRTDSAGAPARPAADDRINGFEGTARVSEAPVYVAPLPSVIVPVPPRPCELAATVVIHGLGCATCEAPLVLPAEAATYTPASAANRNATSTGSRKFVRVPLIEKLITSTPSATAWSIAAMLSELAQPPSPASSQQTLYAAMRARGAIPLIFPNPAASPVAWMPLLPPAVEAVWLP